jgi:hypothetical protein
VTSGIIHRELVADCPFSVAQEYAEGYLRAAESGSDGGVVRAGPFARRVVIAHGARSDVTETGRAHDELQLRWSARSPLLPDFHGTLRLRIEGERTRLVLDGRYVPPGGPLGAFFDAVVGKHVAAATADDFLRRIAGALAERERNWRDAAGGPSQSG